MYLKLHPENINPIAILNHKSAVSGIVKQQAYRTVPAKLTTKDATH